MKAFFNWSGGKDSALALYHAQKDKRYSIEKLLTNINGKHRRISMHGVREELLELQSQAIGLPLQKIILPEEPSMQEYENTMRETMEEFQKKEFTHAFFGDIFLEDLKKYREEQLAKAGINAVFPLWKRNTVELMHEFIDLGFKTILVCIKAEALPKEFAGRIIDKDFLKDLPKNVDACGENGEFHSFVFDGPIFKQPIAIKVGEKVFREYTAPKDEKNNCFIRQPPSSMGFWFCDLLPA
ncbi:MAG: diphthine--ammonia ligase [Ginsengibacter sp.]